MSKIKINYLLILICLFTSLGANEENKSSLYYTKLGVTMPPGGCNIVLPTIGYGARFQENNHGIDLSANLASILAVNYVSLKGVFLFYPQLKKNNQLYYGIGPGLGYYRNPFMMGGTCGNYKYGIATAEGIIGYEFRHAYVTFIQLEVSQPAIRFTGKANYEPGVALTLGIEF